MSSSEDESSDEEIIGDSYVPIKDLGRGMYGEVRLCEHVETKDRVVSLLPARAPMRFVAQLDPSTQQLPTPTSLRRPSRS